MNRTPLVDFLLRPFVAVVARVLFRLKTYNRHIIPKKGGIIIAGNHISDWDPPFIGAAVPRGIYFMAKSELFSNPLSSWFLSALGAFPVYRKASVNKDALNTARDHVLAGKGLVIFPEGTRSKNGRMLPAKAGVGHIAHATGVPVYPFFVRGTDHPLGALFFRTRFLVRFGEPISPEILRKCHEEGGPKRSAEYIMQKVRELKEIEENVKKGKMNERTE